MSDTVMHRHQGPAGVTAVALPFALDDFCTAAEQARRALMKSVPDAFTRDEWAYLLGSLSGDTIRSQFHAVFGPPAAADAPLQWIASPRGSVAVWLPANVSLLGPLTLLALLASGNAVRLKASTRAVDLTTAFMQAVNSSAPAFARHFERVSIASFGRDDPRNREMAAQAQVRAVFGSDEAAREIHGLPQPLESVALSFVDRRSEAWIELAAVTDDTLRQLIAVFAIYGQAGCTSPSRVVLLDANPEQALVFRDRLAELWPSVVRGDVPMHVASEVTKLLHLSRAQGWNVRLVDRHKALLAVGSAELPRSSAGMALWIVPATLEQARSTLPTNIQTVGHAVLDPQAPCWQAQASHLRLRRWVPLRRMHHFGWVWDGEEYWRHLFRWTEFAQ